MTLDEQIAIARARINDLKNAMAFFDACAIDANSLETGASRDAFEWLEMAARAASQIDPASIVASVPQPVEFPAFEDSKTGPHEAWKNPLAPIAENLEIADGAIAFRDGIIANLRAQLAKAQQPATSSDAAEPLCEDEGCPHHGRPHICLNRCPDAPEMPEPVSHERIRDLMLASGFTIKDGLTDLKPYVYAAAHAIAAERDRQWQALREKDLEHAAMYRWLRERHWSFSDVCVVLNPKDNVILGAVCPSHENLDQLICEAIAKEQDE